MASVPMAHKSLQIALSGEDCAGERPFACIVQHVACCTANRSACSCRATRMRLLISAHRGRFAALSLSSTALVAALRQPSTHPAQQLTAACKLPREGRRS